MTPQIALALLLIIPLTAAVLIPVFGKTPNIREGVTFVAGLALLATVAYLCVDVAQGGRPELHFGSFAGKFDFTLKLEPLGATFAAIASSLWIVNSMFTLGYMRGNNEVKQTRFFACVAIAIAAAMGIAASANLITLFIFYEALTISTFPLVTHKGDAKAKRGGTIYALILMGTSLALLLPAIIGTYVIAGTTDFVVGGIFPEGTSLFATSILLILFAFGIGKAYSELSRRQLRYIERHIQYVLTDRVRDLVPHTTGMRRAVDKAIFPVVQISIIPTVEGSALYAEFIKRPLGWVR